MASDIIILSNIIMINQLRGMDTQNHWHVHVGHVLHRHAEDTPACMSLEC